MNKAARAAVYAGLLVSTLLVTFFGLGPVLLADGSAIERAFTLLIVAACYLGLTAAFVWLQRRSGK